MTLSDLQFKWTCEKGHQFGKNIKNPLPVIALLI